MDYLTDSATLKFNGSDKRMGIAVSHGHLIAFFRKGGFLDDLAITAAVLGAMAVPIIAVPAALTALGAAKLLGKDVETSLAENVAKIRNKFKLAEDQILISNNEHSTATLSGNSFMTFGNTNVRIAGDFAQGSIIVKCTIETYFTVGKPKIQKIFENNGYRTIIN